MEPDEEREVWRKHFRTVMSATGQLGGDGAGEEFAKGMVVTKGMKQAAKVMGRDIERKEVERALGKLQAGKAAGEDGVMAES